MTSHPAPTGADFRRGEFRVGDRVQLTDPKKRMHTITLGVGKAFHTSKGAIEHDALIGRPEGVVVSSTQGVTYLALRPLLSDFVLAMPRGATIAGPAAVPTFCRKHPVCALTEATSNTM